MSSAKEWEFVVAPCHKKANESHPEAYPERTLGVNFREKHREWCRQVLPLPLYVERMNVLNLELEAKGFAILMLEELVGGRLYTGRLPPHQPTPRTHHCRPTHALARCGTRRAYV